MNSVLVVIEFLVKFHSWCKFIRWHLHFVNWIWPLRNVGYIVFASQRFCFYKMQREIFHLFRRFMLLLIHIAYRWMHTRCSNNWVRFINEHRAQHTRGYKWITLLWRHMAKLMAFVMVRKLHGRPTPKTGEFDVCVCWCTIFNATFVFCFDSAGEFIWVRRIWASGLKPSNNKSKKSSQPECMTKKETKVETLEKSMEIALYLP